MKVRRGDEGRGGEPFRNGTRAASTVFVSRMMLRDPQHSGWSIAHYLPFIQHYLVGTSFETGTKRKERKKEHPKTHPCINQTRKGRPPEVILLLQGCASALLGECIHRELSTNGRLRSSTLAVILICVTVYADKEQTRTQRRTRRHNSRGAFRDLVSRTGK